MSKKALWESIKVWETEKLPLLEGGKIPGLGPESCALCLKYHNNYTKKPYPRCGLGCPIKNATRLDYCGSTFYWQIEDSIDDDDIPEAIEYSKKFILWLKDLYKEVYEEEYNEEREPE